MKKTLCILIACVLCIGTLIVAFSEDVHEHTWGDWGIDQAATCTEPGQRSRICLSCGEEEKESIPATGHTWGEWETEQEATCVADGSKVRICTVCGADETEAIPATGEHTPEVIPAKEATCTETGLTEGSKCSVCGEILTAQEEVPMKDHTWGEWETEQEATCVADGSKVRICTVCGADETEVIPATGEHTPEVIPAKEATCTETGLTEGSKCSVCGTILTAQEEIPLKEHTWSEWETVKEATCGEDGKKERICSVCGKDETEVIPATGDHTWGEWEVTEATCGYDGAKERICTTCGEIEVGEVYPATGDHTLSQVDRVEPTCTASGTETYWYCEVCEKIFSDEPAEEELDEPVVIPATGHSWSDWKTTKEPTTSEEGSKERTCSVCGAKETASIAKLDPPASSSNTAAAPSVNETPVEEPVAQVNTAKTSSYQSSASTYAEDVYYLVRYLNGKGKSYQTETTAKNNGKALKILATPESDGNHVAYKYYLKRELVAQWKDSGITSVVIEWNDKVIEVLISDLENEDVTAIQKDAGKDYGYVITVNPDDTALVSVSVMDRSENETPVTDFLHDLTIGSK